LVTQVTLDQVTSWFRLLSTPNGYAIDRTLLTSTSSVGVVDNKEGSAKIRIEVAKALASFANVGSEVHNDHLLNILMQMLSSQAATDRQSAALFITEWTRHMVPDPPPPTPSTLNLLCNQTAEQLAAFPAVIVDTMLELLAGRNEVNFYYTEVLHLIADLKREAESLLLSFKNSGIAFTAPTAPANMTSEQLNDLVRIDPNKTPHNPSNSFLCTGDDLVCSIDPKGPSGAYCPGPAFYTRKAGCSEKSNFNSFGLFRNSANRFAH